jgi:hypothetical protein
MQASYGDAGVSMLFRRDAGSSVHTSLGALKSIFRFSTEKSLIMMIMVIRKYLSKGAQVGSVGK